MLSLPARKLIALALAASLAFTSFSAEALTVFDPSNYAQNMVTAARSVKAEYDRAIQIANQIAQYKEMIRQAKQLADSPRLMKDALEAELRVNEYTKTVYATYGDINRFKGLFDQRYKLSTADKLKYSRDWALTAAGNYKRQEAHVQALQTEIQVARSLEENMAKAKAMQAELPKLASNQATFQFMSTQLALVVQQNNDLLKFLAAQNLRKNQDTEDELTKNELSDKRRKDQDSVLKQQEENPATMKLPPLRAQPK